MRPFFLFVLSTLLFQTGYSQQNLTAIYFDFNKNLVAPINTDRYYEQNLYINGLFKKTIRKKGSDRAYEEFIRYSDTSYLYAQYDSGYNVIKQGIVAIDRSNPTSDVTLTPDLENDPTLEKGLMKNDISYSYGCKKVLFWIEPDSLGFSCQGMYKDGKRNGIWKQGYYTSSTWAGKVFIITKILNYYDGKQEVGYRPDYSLRAIWSKLQGEWWFDASSVNEQYFLSKVQTSNSVFHKINFIDKLYLEKITRSGSQKLKWELKNNVIIIYGSTVEKFLITYLSPDLQLYLTPIKN